MTRVHLDGPQRRRGTTVAWCEDCPPWREIRGSREAALMAAATHLEGVHGLAREAAAKRALAARLRGGDTPTATR